MDKEDEEVPSRGEDEAEDLRDAGGEATGPRRIGMEQTEAATETAREDKEPSDASGSGPPTADTETDSTVELATGTEVISARRSRP